MGFSREYIVGDYLAREADRYAATKFQILLEHMTLDWCSRVLNVGCGSGESNLWLAEKGYIVDAVDPAEEAILMSEKIKERYKLQQFNIFRVSIEEFSPDSLYDGIFALDVLEHLPDDGVVVRKLHGLLRPGGAVFVSVPAMPSLFGYHDVMLGHYRRYIKRDLFERFAPWFDIVYLRYFGFSLIPIAFLFSGLLRRPYPIQKSHTVGILNKGLQLLLAIERKIVFPQGTSLLLVGRKR